MKVKESLEMEEQLRLVEALLYILLYLAICINFFTELKLPTWKNYVHGFLPIFLIECIDNK